MTKRNYVFIPPDHPQGNRPMTDILELEKGTILEPPRDPAVLGFIAVKITQAIASLDRGNADESALLLHEAQEAYFRYITTPRMIKL